MSHPKNWLRSQSTDTYVVTKLVLIVSLTI